MLLDLWGEGAYRTAQVALSPCSNRGLGDGDRATGMQHFVFIDQQTHETRLGWYNDDYRRTPDGWRINRRSTTFMRKHGGFDSGRQHDPLADAN
jgi:hypothetical protein